MNEYLYNMQTIKIKDTILLKNNHKYRMGWKFNCSKKLINLASSDKSTDLNLYVDSNTLLENNDSNNFSNLQKFKKNKTDKYNIYEKYPEFFPELVEQGNMDSCVPTCLSTIFYYNSFKQGNYLNFRISRLFLYYNARELYQEISDDNGARIIDCIKILKKIGSPPEMAHPYNEKFIYKKPNNLSFKLAKYCKLLGFKELQRNEIKKNLLLNYPVICGIKVYDNFNNEKTIKTGKVLLPENNDEIIGGHSIIIVGYDDNKQKYTFINSWGKSWGNDGFGYIPYDYINNVDLADEFFILTQITNPFIDFMYINNELLCNKELRKIINLKESKKSVVLIKILLLSILIIINDIN